LLQALFVGIATIPGFKNLITMLKKFRATPKKQVSGTNLDLTEKMNGKNFPKLFPVTSDKANNSGLQAPARTGETEEDSTQAGNNRSLKENSNGCFY
jgi:hypothetical protein